MIACFVVGEPARAATMTVSVSGTAPEKTLTLRLGGPTRAGITSVGPDLNVSGRVGDTVLA